MKRIPAVPASDEFEVGDVFAQTNGVQKFYMRTKDGWYVFRVEDSHCRSLRLEDEDFEDFLERGIIVPLVEES